MGIHLHLLNASGVFNADRERIDAALAASLERILPLLPPLAVDVVAAAEPWAVIPELGLGGYSPGAHRVQLAFELPLRDGFEADLLAMLGHELHHCARWSGPGYGRSFAEALVSEGLACAFEGELRPSYLPFYAAVELPAAIYELARRQLQYGQYDHAAWFFGSSANIPRHAGYTLGLALARRYQAEHPGTSAAELWAEPAESFLGYLDGL